VPAGAQDIAIGVSIAQSPPGSVVQGVQVKDGVEIMKDYINAHGGRAGPADQARLRGQPGRAREGPRRRREAHHQRQGRRDHGRPPELVCLAEIEVAHRYEVPYVNTNCWSDDIRKKGYAEVFNPSNYNSRVATAMAETIAAMG
jgi:hypothetical protein